MVKLLTLKERFLEDTEFICIFISLKKKTIGKKKKKTSKVVETRVTMPRPCLLEQAMVKLTRVNIF